ncbi:MAG: hypothetical protein HWE14_11830 [Flavobacteriia bacterium]|nr:hypothetical protein [Flavobacteriia bacterium]
MSKVLFGIDFGSKLAGTTVVSIFKQNKIYFMEVEEGVDADNFIMNAARHFKPDIVFIDAPLSLPGRYNNIPGCEDYMFRKADMELKAMSPMFLGGLTARAIRLKDELEAENIEVRETYPKILAHRYELNNLGYKGKTHHINVCRSKLQEALNPRIFMDCQDIKTWHHLDSLLALMSAMNYDMGSSVTYGDENEGSIVV